ncbi:MAG TPA: hypothetical protein VI685_12165 [Candidatus Angelobacter sp.]
MAPIQIFLRPCILLQLLLPLGLNALAQEPAGDISGGTQHTAANAVELVRRAVANYQVRESRTAGYTWLEYQTTRMSFQRGKKYKIFPASRSDGYEVISLAGNFYRRHLTHNDQPLPEQDETIEKQRLEEAIRKTLDEGVRLQPIRDRSIRDQSVEVAYAEAMGAADAQLAEVHSRAAAIRKEMQETVAQIGDDGSILFTAQEFNSVLPNLKLDLQRLSRDFDLRRKGTEILNGRSAYILTAIPRTGQTNSTDAAEDARNFEMRIWIDQAELEIVRMEQKAVRQGAVASKPDYVAMNPVNYPAEAVAKAKGLQYDQSLFYEPGTVITREWIKVNNEIWLPKKLYVQGKETYSCAEVSIAGQVRRAAAPLVVNYERTYSDYQKFRVHTRIFNAKAQ